MGVGESNDRGCGSVASVHDISDSELVLAEVKVLIEQNNALYNMLAIDLCIFGFEWGELGDWLIGSGYSPSSVTQIALSKTCVGLIAEGVVVPKAE